MSAVAGVPASCYDANNPHIMDPSSSSTPPSSWTTCSKAWLTYYIEDGNYGYWSNVPACTENVPTDVWSGATAVCGDGVREAGEQCDCGAQDCADVDLCCNGATCQLVSGAVCSLLDACCQQGSGGSPTQCTFRGSSHTCRAALNSCDQVEKCTGSDAVCPADALTEVGTACSGALSGHAGVCYGGGCQSHTEQCKHTQTWFPPISGECSNKGDDDGTTACGALACTYNAGCSTGFNVGDGVIQVNDGVPCDVNSVCFSQSCVLTSSIPGGPSPTPNPTQGASPTPNPTNVAPTPQPTPLPTSYPTPTPTNAVPTPQPTQLPTSYPTPTPTNVVPTPQPTPLPTSYPTPTPTKHPTIPGYTYHPSMAPTEGDEASAVGEGEPDVLFGQPLAIALGVSVGVVCIVLIITVLIIVIIACVVVSSRRAKTATRRSTGQGLGGRDSLGGSKEMASVGAEREVEMAETTTKKRFNLFAWLGKDAATTEAGSMKDEAGKKLPDGWRRHFDDNEKLSYYTKKGHRATWTLPQGGAAAAAVTKVATAVEADKSTNWRQVRKSARRGTWRTKPQLGKKGLAKGQWAAYRDDESGQTFWTEKCVLCPTLPLEAHTLTPPPPSLPPSPLFHSFPPCTAGRRDAARGPCRARASTGSQTTALRTVGANLSSTTEAWLA